MKIIGLDTETTGLEQSKGHKIIEIAMLTYELETQELVDRFVMRFDPERAIDPGAQAAHGISYTELVGEPKWEDKAEEIAKRMSTADLLVAHNMGFDGPFLAAEFLRVGIEVPDVHSLCTMENARWACPDGKLPRLGELCFALNVPYDPAKAHGADYDTTVTMDCFFRGLARGFYQLPKSLQSMAGFKNCHDAEAVPA
jgi:DNA polymerase-3 subunit epsilon